MKNGVRSTRTVVGGRHWQGAMSPKIKDGQHLEAMVFPPSHAAVGWVLLCLTGMIMSSLTAILWTRRERSYQTMKILRPLLEKSDDTKMCAPSGNETYEAVLRCDVGMDKKDGRI